MGLVWLSGAYLAIIASTPYRGDDRFNRKIPAQVIDHGESLIGYVISYTQSWMTSEGRFFPGSVAWTNFLFWAFPDRVSYKIVIALIAIASAATTAILAARLVSMKTSAIGFAVVLGVLQLRAFHDGLVSFAGLVPLSIALTFAATLILVERRGLRWAVGAGICFAFAIVTYETVIAFTPALIAIVIWRRKVWTPALALAIPATIELAIVIVLRATMPKPPTWTYAANLEFGPFVRTFVKQLVSAFPSSQWIFGSQTAPPLNLGSIALGVAVVGVPTALVVLAPRRPVPVIRGALPLALLGGWIWASSSALVAVSGRWQAELIRGEGYISVVYGYVGLAMILIAVLLAVERSLGTLSPRWLTIWRVVSAVLLATIAVTTFAGNIAVAALPV